MLNGSRHRTESGLENVYFVDFQRRGFTDSYGESFTLNDVEQSFPLWSGQFFGIIQSRNHCIRGKDNGCRYDRPCKASSPGFVDTRHVESAGFPVFRFQRKVRHLFFDEDVFLGIHK